MVDKQTKTQTDRQTHTHTHTDRETNRQTDRLLKQYHHNRCASVKYLVVDLENKNITNVKCSKFCFDQ